MSNNLDMSKIKVPVPEDLYERQDSMVHRLAKNGVDIICDLTPDSAHLLHMAVGISGEVAEAIEAWLCNDAENFAEELGDLEFYLCGYCQAFSAPGLRAYQDPQRHMIHSSWTMDLVFAAGKLLDLTKKVAIYSKPLEHDRKIELLQAVTEVRQCLNTVYAEYDYPRGQAIAKNMQKLLLGKNARYKEGVYSDKQAQDRADKQGE